MTTIADILQALQPVQDPELRRSVVDLGMIRDVEIEDHNVRLTLALTTLACPLSDSLAGQVHNAVAALPGVGHVGVQISEMSRKEVGQLMARLQAQNAQSSGGNGGKPGTTLHPKGNLPLSFSLDPKDAAPFKSLAQTLSPIEHVIGVTSGKGGVGKSMVTGMLAVGLNRMGYKVGIFDIDITGASIPHLFGMNGRRMKNSPEGIIPARSEEGIRLVSANFMLENPDDPVAWRGSRIAQLISDLWRNVIWGPLDYLLFDFPPGTSDVQLTAMMDLPVQGLVMVTTPQELANLIVRKAIKMSAEMNVPLLGVVENMSYFACPDTGSQHEIFGPSHAGEVAAQAGTSVIARLPVDPALAQACDAGQLEAHQFEPAREMTKFVVQKVENLENAAAKE
ncbi:MAG: Mrp/NBP35 family ATP-binding protein [Chloroflexi bacterium]|nr:Mrp/NBP35 family ATP-binding protein [Chloroflexota bacterium]